MPRARVLVIDRSKRHTEALVEMLDSEIEVVCESMASSALGALARESFDLVIVDVGACDEDGLAVIARIRRRHEGPVIATSASATIEGAVRAVKRGATEFLRKPFDADRTRNAVEEALRLRHPTLPYREAVAAERTRARRDYIVRLLVETKGNVTQAAERAGIERESFHRLMKRYAVRAEDYRPK